MKQISLIAISLLTLLSAPFFSFATGPCENEQHQAFNFWLGHWTVTKKDGTVAGENTITSEYGSCVIHERYTTPNGYKGESLNIFDRTRNIWHQTWVDNTGLLLTLEGQYENGTMVLSGEGQNQLGQTVAHRITWTANKDGTVRQHWQTSSDGMTWQTAFDGLYTRSPTPSERSK